MPVTAKLSKRFYETFGDENTNELVDWFNAVDTDYKSSLREMNEQNFARFDATLRERLGEFGATFEKRFAALETRFAAIDARFAASEARMIRWMFTFWTGTMLALAGFVFAVLRTR